MSEYSKSSAKVTINFQLYGREAKSFSFQRLHERAFCIKQSDWRKKETVGGY